MKNLNAVLLVGLIMFSCKSSNKVSYVYETKTLKIYPITKNVYVHVSFLDIPNYGKFPCNGVIYIKDGEAVILDTPVDDISSKELIDWVQKTKKINIKGVVVNHFHEDCLGGLGEFHAAGIESYANNKTKKLASSVGNVQPKIGFNQKLELEVGNSIVISEYLGEAHTKDNIVSYIPEESVLFGGCMIKAIGASKGNVADANLVEWSKTVRSILLKYPNLKVVIPGHGNTGGNELLTYTINLFED